MHLAIIIFLCLDNSFLPVTLGARMAENNILLCEDCMALAINDRIIDHISEDLPQMREFQEQPELEIDCRKYDTLPQLPKLAAAADEGCQFCAFLMVFILNCYCQLLDSNIDRTSDESTFDSLQLSVTIDRIRYIRENDPIVAGFVTQHAQAGIIGLAADIHIYHEELDKQLFHTTSWLPVRANDSK